ncbi:uncharacterized protein LOC113373530 [Ctenocephalides felis]|uniref:uncharacterized protein LOC113373530 n=1 Tax=Ctenocephalides felis TaxID=7515 RepID=UPI000E6E1613|nr:uncharacterized protein LOC113373530 [Ctenocephalides felis]
MLENTAPVIVVRAEEILIVLLVLILWVAAIALFFNRWGKIRMLEPYQPKFQQQHRSSCPLVDSQIQNGPQFQMCHPGLSRPSFSKCGAYSCPESSVVPPSFIPRPRQNSVFVGFGGPATALYDVGQAHPPRKTRSAVDIHSLVLQESSLPVMRQLGSSYATHV